MVPGLLPGGAWTKHFSTYELEYEDGRPADPPTLDVAAPTWRPGETILADPSTFDTAKSTWRVGDTIPLGRDRILRVIEIRPGRGA
jgi:hypothetical protein